MKTSLGQKIKYFRERAGKTQFEIELMINAATGSLSRIEKDKTNPSKETIQKIAEVLGLNKFEIDYMIGQTIDPPTPDEVQRAIEEVHEYFQRKGVLAYLVDDRYRIIAVSKDFPRLTGFSANDVNKLLLKSLSSVMIDPQYKVRALIENDNYEETLYHNLTKYYYEVSFMQAEETQREALKTIYADPIARKVWQKITSNPPQNVNTLESRRVRFTVGKIHFDMTYSAEYLSRNQRFVLIEYTPSFVLRVLRQLS